MKPSEAAAKLRENADVLEDLDEPVERLKIKMTGVEAALDDVDTAVTSLTGEVEEKEEEDKDEDEDEDDLEDEDEKDEDEEDETDKK